MLLFQFSCHSLRFHLMTKLGARFIVVIQLRVYVVLGALVDGAEGDPPAAVVHVAGLDGGVAAVQVQLRVRGGVGREHLERGRLVLQLVPHVSLVQHQSKLHVACVMAVVVWWQVDVVEHHLPRAHLPRHVVPGQHARAEKLRHHRVLHSLRPALDRKEIFPSLNIPLVHGNAVDVITRKLAGSLRDPVRRYAPVIQVHLQRGGVQAGQQVVHLQHEVVLRQLLSDVEVVVGEGVGLARAAHRVARVQLRHARVRVRGQAQVVRQRGARLRHGQQVHLDLVVGARLAAVQAQVVQARGHVAQHHLRRVVVNHLLQVVHPAVGRHQLDGGVLAARQVVHVPRVHREGESHVVPLAGAALSLCRGG
mmetsp:Transcript_46724/g.87024  ORF Transcript_46724/g.87024 Transcript_46724/m.87024 type:complete len:364 (-) Transcript_46724:2395-3486(-)